MNKLTFPGSPEDDGSPSSRHIPENQPLETSFTAASNPRGSYRPGDLARAITRERVDMGTLLSVKSEDEARIYLEQSIENLSSGEESYLKKKQVGLKVELNGVDRQLKKAKDSLDTIPPTLEAQNTSSAYQLPANPIERVAVLGFLLAGVLLTGLGWFNSSRVALTFLQDPVLSYGFTAPLLALPIAIHLATKRLHIPPGIMAGLLGAVAMSGAVVLVTELGRAAEPADVLATGNGPDPLRLMLGQVLLEIGTGVLLISRVEERIRRYVSRTPNPDYEAQRRNVSQAEEAKSARNDELAQVEAELESITVAKKLWVNTHLHRWRHLKSEK